MANNSTYMRPVIPAGNSFYINIALDKFIDGAYTEFDLTKATDLKVYLICATHNTEIPLDYEIIPGIDNVLRCFVDFRLLHTTSYGIAVEGYDEHDIHFRFLMLPKEGFLVVNNTSGMKVTDDVQIVDISGRVGWGIQTDGDLTNYYTKTQVDNMIAEIEVEIGDTYTKEEINQLLTQYPTNTEINTRFNNYYTKQDTNSLLDNKQDELVSGQNIKTINNQSLLGSGNIVIEGTEQLQADWTQTDTSAKDYIKHKPTIPAAQVNSDWNATSGVAKILNKPDLSIYATEQELDNYYDKGETDGLLNNKVDVSTLNNDYYNKNTVDNLLDAKVDTSDLATVATSGSYNDLTNKPDLSVYATHTELNTKQDTLISGTNIKTINNQSLLGSGNVDIQSGGFVPLVNGNKTGLVNSLSVDYDTNIGNKAIIEGCGNGSSVTRASGDYSHTEGLETIASGESAHAEGYHTQATADMAHAEGDLTKAFGTHSHAEGSGTYATGNNAHAEGAGSTTVDPRSLPNNTTDVGNNGLEARGEHSHAEGWATKAFGPKSHAEGERSIATGQMAHAEGLETIASGVCSHSEGDNTRATGTHAHAEGWQTRATGENSHAEGNATQARSLGSHAEGDHTTAGRQNCNNCHAEGYSTTAIGDNSHAEGINTLADGDYSHAEGNTTRTDGEDAHAEGSSTVAVGDHSHTEGYGTRANNESEHASGYCNVSTASSNGRFDSTNSTATLFSVGNGADPNHRHNAFEIKMNGDIYLNDGTKLQDKLDDSDEVTANALYELNSRLSETEFNVNLIPDEIDSKIVPVNEKIDDISNDITDLTNDIDNTNLANSLILTELHNEIDDKQDELVSGTNIKTINGTSLLGSGDITVGSASNYRIYIEWQRWNKEISGIDGIYFKNVSLYDASTQTTLYTKTPTSTNSLNNIFNELYNQFGISSIIRIDDVNVNWSNFTFTMYNNYYIMPLPQTIQNNLFGNASIINIESNILDSSFHVTQRLNSIVIPLLAGMNKAVTSTSSGLKVETASSAPSGTVPVTLAFDSTTNILYIVQ